MTGVKKGCGMYYPEWDVLLIGHLLISSLYTCKLTFLKALKIATINVDTLLKSTLEGNL